MLNNFSHVIFVLFHWHMLPITRPSFESCIVCTKKYGRSNRTSWRRSLIKGSGKTLRFRHQNSYIERNSQPLTNTEISLYLCTKIRRVFKDILVFTISNLFLSYFRPSMTVSETHNASQSTLISKYSELKPDLLNVSDDQKQNKLSWNASVLRRTHSWNWEQSQVTHDQGPEG